MNKLAHTLILAVFGIACFFLWGILTLTPHGSHGHPVPAFTLFCFALRPVMMVLPLMAAVYCLWVWFRKADRLPSWRWFSLPMTMSVLVLILHCRH